MRELTEKELETVTELAGVGFDIEQISIMLEVDFESLKTLFLDKSAFYKAYKKGQLQMEFKVRNSVFKLAAMGHSDAQKRADKYLTNQKLEDE